MLNYNNDFWEWDQATNIWTQKANFGWTARRGPVGFSIGAKGYIGTGNDSISLLQDFWEFDASVNAISQNENAIEINIFPNPSSDFINVNYKSKTSHVQFEIIDVMGRKVSNVQHLTSNIQLNVSKLPQGLYLLKVTDGDLVFSKRFIKN